MILFNEAWIDAMGVDMVKVEGSSKWCVAVYIGRLSHYGPWHDTKEAATTEAEELVAEIEDELA